MTSTDRMQAWPAPPAGEPAAAADCLRVAQRSAMRIQEMDIGGCPALVVDGVYADPWALRQLALEQDFSRRAGNYPGGFAVLPHAPGELLALINDLLAQRLGARLAFSPHYRNLTLAAAFTPPEALAPLQRQAHFDSFCDYAGIVHLSPDDAAAGAGTDAGASGTSFWRHRRTGWERAPLDRLSVDPVTARQIEQVMLEGLVMPASGYPVESNLLWCLASIVPRRFNRLLVYDARVFHAPHIPHFMPAADLAGVRMTQNLFLNRVPAQAH
jgi:hypothetical protein